MAADVWRDLKRAAGDVGVIREKEMRLELPGGGSVTIKSADNPDSLRGRGLDGVVLDEAAFCDADTWHRSLRPALADRKGWALILSSPNGKNWFYDLFQHAGADSEWDRWQRPSTDNPLVTPAEIAAASKEIGPAASAQEFGGQFTSVDGAEFPGEWFGEHIWFRDWPDAWRLRTMALDPSKGRDAKHGDYSAYALVQVDVTGTIYVQADLERRPVPRMIGDGVELYREFRPDAFCIEGNAWQDLLGGEFQRAFAEAGLIEFAPYLIDNHVKKEVRIRRLSSWLSDGRIKFRANHPGTKLLVDQLREFPLAMHDDGPDALEMAIRLAQMVAADSVANDDEYEVAG